MPSPLLDLSVLFLLGLALPALVVWRLLRAGERLAPPEGAADRVGVLRTVGAALGRRIQPEQYALALALLLAEWGGFFLYATLVAARRVTRSSLVEVVLFGVALLVALGVVWRGTMIARRRRLSDSL